MSYRRDFNRAAAAQAKLEELLSKTGGISGIGLGRSSDGYTIRVLTAGSAAQIGIPDEIDGFPICVETVGVIRPTRH